ncbi:MAG: hypothetical protein V4447_07060 [Pseudomonadota bacterium]
MNPYLIMLKMKKLSTSPLTELTQGPFVSSVSGENSQLHKTNHPFVSSVSAIDIPVSKIDTLRGFVELDDFALTDTRKLARSSVKPRQAREWLALFADLDVMIERYCAALGSTRKDEATILIIRYVQPFTSIPESLSWLKEKLERMDKKMR